MDQTEIPDTEPMQQVDIPGINATILVTQDLGIVSSFSMFHLITGRPQDLA